MGNDTSTPSQLFSSERGAQASQRRPPVSRSPGLDDLVHQQTVTQQRRQNRLQTGSKPGAYPIPGPGRRSGTDAIPYTVTVPNGVRPGQEFQVMAGGVPMMVRGEGYALGDTARQFRRAGLGLGLGLGLGVVEGGPWSTGLVRVVSSAATCAPVGPMPAKRFVPFLRTHVGGCACVCVCASSVSVMVTEIYRTFRRCRARPYV
ncbi:unnamed protein product [Discosporangium mesarthrocarpum]